MLTMVVRFILLCLYASSSLHRIEGAENLLKNVSVSAVLAFGDSYVDTGNNNHIKTLVKANFLPYGKDFVNGKPTGRFTNGKSLADIFVRALGVKEFLPAYLDPFITDNDLQTGVSFASGGTGYDPLTSTILSVIPLSDQLDLLKEYIQRLEGNVGKEGAMNIISKSVFLLSSSTNDLSISYSTIPIRRLQYDVNTYVKKLVEMAMSFVQELHKLGARRIVVLSAPPVGCLPALRTLAGGPLRMCADRENEAALLFNNMLKQNLQDLASSLLQSRISFVDYYNPLISIIENPHQYGLEVTDKGCCGTGNIEVVVLCNKHTKTCEDDSKFLFWDSIHLSEKGCSIFADQVLPDLLKTLQ